jgi:lipoprotein NlpI
MVGDLDGALADYNRAIGLNRKDAGAYNDRGNIKRTKHDLDGAVADYSRAIELDGSNAVAYFNRGITKQYKGDIDGALADFSPAIELDPKNAAIYHSRGAAKAIKGDLAGALADYNRAIELDPKGPSTYANRASVYFVNRKWDAALEDYKHFFELSKENQEYSRLYVWVIRARTGQKDAAKSELEDYLQTRGTTVDWFAIVASFLLDGITEQDLLTAAKSSDKTQETGQLCESWFYIGMKKLIAGDKAGAETAFGQSIATGRRDYTEYYFSRAELRALQK